MVPHSLIVEVEEALKEDPTIIEVQNAPKELEEGGQSTVDDNVEINLGSDEDLRPTTISASLAEEERHRLKVQYELTSY